MIFLHFREFLSIVSVFRERGAFRTPRRRRRRSFFFLRLVITLPTITPFETPSRWVNVFSSSWIQANAILHSSGLKAPFLPNPIYRLLDETRPSRLRAFSAGSASPPSRPQWNGEREGRGRWRRRQKAAAWNGEASNQRFTICQSSSNKLSEFYSRQV